MSSDPGIRYEKRGQVAIITMDRPEKMNALTPHMFEELEAAFVEFNNDSTLRVAILTGAGEKAFSSGADLGETIPRATAGEVQLTPDRTKRYLGDVFKPIIGAVNGYCIAGGLEILEGTDIRVAAEHATFGLGEVRWGIVPGGGSHVRLPRQIPWAVAMEIILTGQPIDAKRAYEIGLVNRVVPLPDLMPAALQLATVICENGPVAVRTAKEIAVRSLGLESGFVLESLMAERVRLYSEDAREGPRAFMEKRRPAFLGR